MSFFQLLAIACPKSGHRFSEQELVGTYDISKLGTPDSLTLRPDGTYRYERLANGRPIQEDGHWEIYHTGGGIQLKVTKLCITWDVLGLPCLERVCQVELIGRKIALDIYSDDGLYYVKQDATWLRLISSSTSPRVRRGLEPMGSHGRRRAGESISLPVTSNRLEVKSLLDQRAPH